LDDGTFIRNSAPCTFKLSGGGTAIGSFGNVLYSWVVPNAHAGSYECLATMISGVLNSGVVGSWQVLSTTRSWTLGTSSQTGGSKQAKFTLQIRKIGTGTILKTATITLMWESMS
jgi:hypothetical protein